MINPLNNPRLPRLDTALIANIPIFKGLDRADVEAIALAAIEQRIPKNSVLVHEGEQPDALYIIVSGKAKVSVNDEDGRELILYLLEPGSFFGELAILDGAPRSASVQTTERSILLKITSANFQKHLREKPEISLNLMRELSYRVRGVNEHIRDLALLDVYGRIARTLLRLAKETSSGFETDPITQQELANMVGASREMVSRIINNLRSDGYIEIRSKRIRILTPPPARR